MHRPPRFALPAIFTLSLALLHSYSAIGAQSPTAGPTQLSGTFRIAGTVVSLVDGHPLDRARVTITDTKNSKNFQSTITSEDGRFEFKQVGPGKYSLQGARRGFIPAAYDEHEQFSTAIVTGPDLDTENLMLHLAPTAMLSGKVFDEFGDAVRHATVTLYREDHQSGVSRIRRFRNAQTDDQGSYVLSPLNAGTYFLSVMATPWYALHPFSPVRQETQNSSGAMDRSLDVAYPVTYYADSTDPEAATPIPIKGGDHPQVDFHLAPVPALHLRFHIAQNAGEQIGMPMLQKRGLDGTDAGQNNIETQMVSPGVFEMTGLAPGSYTVRTPATTSGQSARINDVDITNDDQELDTSSGEPTGSVKALIQLPGESKLPPQLNLALRDGRGRIAAWAAVDTKGEADFQEVAPGNYAVLVQSPGRAFSVVRISSQGHESSGHTLTVAAGMPLTISLTLVGSTSSVSGFAKRARKAAPGAMVVLVPKDPDSNRELFRRDQSDLDGSFTLPNVIPGSYAIVAIEKGWSLDWSRPSVVAVYAQHGQAVIVPDRAERPIHLPDAVEVQAP
jgi:hypothetical protein